MPISTVEPELIDLDTPLTWSNDRHNERRLNRHIQQWIQAHPIRIDDSAGTIVTREIYVGIHVVLVDPRPDVEREVDYYRVKRQITNDSRIVGSLQQDCFAALDTIWHIIAIVLEFGFTRHAPDD